MRRDGQPRVHQVATTIRPATDDLAVRAAWYQGSVGRTNAPIVHSIEVDRSPDEVFRYVTDPARFGEWQYDVVRVRVEDDAPLGKGSRFTTTRKVGRSERIMTQEIVEVDPPRRWAARGVAGPIRPNARILVEPVADGRRSRVTFELAFRGHGVGVLLVAAVRRMAAKGAPLSYRRLKELLDQAPGNDGPGA